MRCAFHGWKFDVDGNCVDLPTSPPESSYKDTIKLLAYPTREWGDMIWVYMGPQGAMPELPQLEIGLVPAASRYVTKKWQDCNWVQSVEGALDTSHFSFLHAVLSKDDATARAALAKAAIADQSDARRSHPLDPQRPAAEIHRARPRCRPADRRGAQDRRGRSLLAHLAVPDAQPRLYADRLPRRDLLWPVLGAGRRRDVLDLHLLLAARPAVQQCRAHEVRRRLQRPCRGRRRLHAAAQPAQRLPDRPQGAEARHLHRHRGRERAGRRDPGQHGADPGPHDASISARPTSASSSSASC